MTTSIISIDSDSDEVAQLSAAIDKGLESGIAEDFEPTSFLWSLKARRND